MTMRTIYGLAIGLFVVGALALPAQAQAATTYYYSSSTEVAVKLQALIAQLKDLQRQLAELRGTSSGISGSRTDVERVDVELFDDYAEVTIEYRDGDEDEMLFDADSREEVIDFLVDETRNSRSHLLAVTDFSRGEDDDDDNDIDDIRRIDVEIRNGDAHVDVRYEDGERDTFTIRNETDEDEIIEEIADELDLDEDDVDDLIDFEDDDNDDEDIDKIKVTIFEDDDEAEARVIFEDGSSDRYDFNTDDEDEIIEELADILNEDEDDIEDLADFEYDDGRDDEDIDEIEVTIDEDDEEATARVRWEDGGTTTYRFDTDDEDDIIEDLAELLDMDEDDVEDLVDFEYED